MGIHRDGEKWSLPREIVEERRKVFWELNAADIFQVSNQGVRNVVNTLISRRTAFLARERKTSMGDLPRSQAGPL